MNLKPGSRFCSAVCDVEVIVISAPKTEISLECGGYSMVPVGQERPAGLTPAADHSAGCLVGKRYFHEESGLQLLCSKAGAGSLSVNGEPIGVKEAKKLPSSD